MADTLNTEAEPLNVESVRKALEQVTDRGAGETFDIVSGFSGSGPTGYVVRNDFRGVIAAERYRWLSRFFEREFRDRAGQIGLVLTFTPEEFEGWLEDREGRKT